MTKKLVVVDEAREELRQAARYYEGERDGLGLEFVAAVEDVFDRLSSGRAAPGTVPAIPNELGIRRVLLNRFPFAVIHIDEGDVVHVLAIAHLRREPGYWLVRVQGQGP